MTAPYYTDESVTLYHGRCEDVLPQLPPSSVDVLLTDPPYFQVKDDDWDNQWAEADEFLIWLGGVLDTATPLLRDTASTWMFASAAMTSRVEREVIAPRLRLLNSIRWVKQDSTHNRAEIASLRKYIAAWEGLLLAEQAEPLALHAAVFAPLAEYIAGEREAAGLTRRHVASHLRGYKNPDSAAANIANWELGKNLISERDYLALQAALGPGRLPRSYLDVRRQWDALQAQYETRRRPFTLARTQGPITDVWTFPSVESYPGKHPCEKPAALLRHIIDTTSRPGDLILDPFAGSGSTLLTARNASRRAIGIESDERWCEHAARRLSQCVFDFEGIA